MGPLSLRFPGVVTKPTGALEEASRGPIGKRETYLYRTGGEGRLKRRDVLLSSSQAQARAMMSKDAAPVSATSLAGASQLTGGTEDPAITSRGNECTKCTMLLGNEAALPPPRVGIHTAAGD